MQVLFTHVGYGEVVRDSDGNYWQITGRSYRNPESVTLSPYELGKGTIQGQPSVRLTEVEFNARGFEYPS